MTALFQMFQGFRVSIVEEGKWQSKTLKISKYGSWRVA
jgi:hypothetical protein